MRGVDFRCLSFASVPRWEKRNQSGTFIWEWGFECKCSWTQWDSKWERHKYLKRCCKSLRQIYKWKITLILWRMLTHLVESLMMRPHRKHSSPCSEMNSYVQVVEDTECEPVSLHWCLCTSHSSCLIEGGDDGRVPVWHFLKLSMKQWNST